jgi:plastocyanin
MAGKIDIRLLGTVEMRSDFADGKRLWKKTRAQAAALSRKNGPTVLVGAMDNRTMLMRFVPHTISARRGHKVHFLATSMMPHTVTFGDDQTGCGSPPCDPGAPWNVVQTSDGNEAASYPGHNGGYTGSPTDLNSGVLFGAPPSMSGVPQELSLTLTKRGSYPYTCALHDYLGMVGTVSVERAASRAAR